LAYKNYNMPHSPIPQPPVQGTCFFTLFLCQGIFICQIRGDIDHTLIQIYLRELTRLNVLKIGQTKTEGFFGYVGGPELYLETAVYEENPVLPDLEEDLVVLVSQTRKVSAEIEDYI
jgi:hypothetical protein